MLQALISSFFKIWLPFLLTQYYKVSVWSVGYTILPVFLGGLVQLFLIFPALRWLLQDTTLTLRYDLSHLKILSCASIILSGSLLIFHHINLPNSAYILFSIGLSTNLTTNHLFISEIAQKYTKIFEEHLPYSQIPNFRSLESLLLGFTYLGSGLGCLIFTWVVHYYELCLLHVTPSNLVHLNSDTQIVSPNDSHSITDQNDLYFHHSIYQQYFTYLSVLSIISSILYYISRKSVLNLIGSNESV